MDPRGRTPTFCIAGATPDPDPAPGLSSRLAGLAERRGWQPLFLDARAGEHMDESAALVLQRGVGIESVRRQFPHALVVAETPGTGADLAVPPGSDDAALEALLGHAERLWRRNLKMLELFREVSARRERMGQLADIALSLSTQMEFDELLQTILLEARRLAGCDAGSLYLIDEGGPEPALMFKLAQNDSVTVPFVEQRLPLTAESLAGYVALTGEALDIRDVYQIPEAAPYRFNGSFDEQMGYRTKSMLVLPMRDHRDQVVGVLQFINRLDPTADEPVPFGEEIVELLRAVASQAAVFIQKNLLIRDVNRLFESFVQASVKAIEQRDPSTSGHSFRVAESTVALLEALPRSSVARFRDLQFGEAHLKEVRYAALLHDFGKVGVREHVLLKANKLSDERLETVRYRIELQKERIRRQAIERELSLLHEGVVGLDVARRRVRRELDAELETLDAYFECIAKANRPSLLDDGDFDGLREIREYTYREFDGTLNGLITDNDLLALSVRRGSLTPEERREIQSHVIHTREFLSVLPWPPELARVPEIAGAHHEKLDGSGYPEGLIGEQIPLASRVMTVCDIYDALTAMDRPYKQAISPEAALRILEEEARAGMLDPDMVRIFIDSQIYERIWAEHRRRKVV